MSHKFTKYSEYLRHIATLVVTQDEFTNLLSVNSSCAEDGFFYSAWICNTISGKADPFSKKLRATIKRKIETKKGKGSPSTFTGTFIKNFDPEQNKQYRINWLLTLAEIYESKGN